MSTNVNATNVISDSEIQAQFLLGEWLVNPQTLSISKNQSQIKLEPKVMDLLLLLANHPGQVVSRQTLEETLWAGTVVSYDAISKAIIKLRKALGDSSNRSEYVETIPKRGYRLIAKIENSQATIANDISDKKSANNLLVSSVVTSAVLILSLILWQVSHNFSAQTPHVSSNAAQLGITVVPLHNLSNNAEDDYFAAGLTSDLITDLAKVSELRIVSHKSSSQLLDDESSNKTFEVNYELSGDVSRFENQIRINIRLEDLNKKQYLWTERYNRKLTDLFVLQDEIAKKVVRTLALKLSEQEKIRLARRYTSSITAYDLFLRAQAKQLIYSAETNQQARELYQQAIAEDQMFARAHAGLALTYALDFRHNWRSEVADPLTQATEIVHHALNLDKNLAEVHWILSYIYNIRGDFKQAYDYIQRTLEIEPSYADAYALLTGIYTYQEKYDLALEAIQTAFQLNPGGGQLYFSQLAKVQYFTGKLKAATQSLQRAYSRNPSNLKTLIYLVAVYNQQGLRDDASWIKKELQIQHPNFDFERWINESQIESNRQRQQLTRDFLD